MNHPTKKRLTLALLAASLTLALAGCGGGGGGDDTGSKEGTGSEVAFTEIEAASFSAITSFRTAQVSSKDAWAALWAEHKAKQTPQPALPDVDFGKSMVGAIFLGDSEPCARVQVKSVAFENQTNPTLIAVMRVDYRVIKAGPADTCLAAVTQPSQIIRIEHAAPVQLKFVKVD